MPFVIAMPHLWLPLWFGAVASPAAIRLWLPCADHLSMAMGGQRATGDDARRADAKIPPSLRSRFMMAWMRADIGCPAHRASPSREE